VNVVNASRNSINSGNTAVVLCRTSYIIMITVYSISGGSNKKAGNQVPALTGGFLSG